MTPFSFKRKAKTQEHPVISAPAIRPENPGGRFDVNLVRMVTEHGPMRIKSIDDEIAALMNKVDKLQKEKETIQRLVDAAK